MVLINFLKKRPYIILYVLLILLFWFKGFLYLDPDFGWRIKAGEIYVNQGIPKTDPFSYTMPSFPWVDHAWLTSLFFYIVNKNFGYQVLSAIMAILTISALFFAAKSIPKIFYSKDFYKNTEIFLGGKFFPAIFIKPDFDSLHFFANLSFFLVASILFTFFGVRAQVITWFMFSVLLFWLSDEKRLKKVKFLLPAFFLIWTNFHGGFVLGLVVYFLYLLIKFFKTRKISSLDILLAASNLLVTFVNPYGPGVWGEVWSSFSDTNLRWNIAEWMPALTMFDASMVFLISLSVIFVWKYKKNFSLFEVILYFLLFFQAIGSRRQLPIWGLFTLAITTKGIFYFWQDIKKIRGAVIKFANVYKIAWLLVIFAFSFQVFFALKEALYIGKGNFYPVKAVAYLSQELPSGQIFSDYGWGGYLILNLPQKKVFIDGRMPSWKWSQNPTNELSNPFDTYNQILKGDVEYKEIFNEFGIDTVLTGVKTQNPSDTFYDKAENFLTLFGWEKNDFSLLDTLENDGWQKVYEDEVSVIYQEEWAN